MNKLIEVTRLRNHFEDGITYKKILIGTEHIISVEPSKTGGRPCTKIQSRAAMVTSWHVDETVEQIKKLIEDGKR